VALVKDDKRRAQTAAKLRAFLAARDANNLKSLSGDCAEHAFLFEDGALLDAGLLAYACAKFLDKPYIAESKEWREYSRRTIGELERATALFKEGKSEAGAQTLHALVDEAEALSATLGRFARSVVEKARVKAATQMYAHGASLGKAVEMTGANKKDVFAYIGGTRLQEQYATISARQRFENARKLFQ
jgi:hypothetical protein